jgi:folate-binding protein YgfZ
VARSRTQVYGRREGSVYHARMGDPSTVDLLASGRAFTDLTGWRKVAVRGADAAAWLNDLVSADLSGMEPGQARRSLLLSPTGRIRAEFAVAAREDGFLLLQDPTQSKGIGDLLAPYVLSSEVTLEDRTADLALLAVPGGLPEVPAGASPSTPSCLGQGVDLLMEAVDRDRVALALTGRLVEAGPQEVEAWRILVAIPRLGVDATEEDLPQEGGFGDAVAFDKGCYLGQEAVAKVRNLGHPRRLVSALFADAPVSVGESVKAAGDDAGVVTSAAAADGGWALMARVAWHARDAHLTTASGGALKRRS